MPIQRRRAVTMMLFRRAEGYLREHCGATPRHRTTYRLKTRQLERQGAYCLLVDGLLASASVDASITQYLFA